MVSRIALTLIAVQVAAFALPAGAHSSAPKRAAIAQGCAGANERPDDAASRLLASVAVTCLLNVERARRYLPRLSTSKLLGSSASYQAADMVRHTYFAHVSPSGETLRMRVGRTGYIRGSRRFILGETSGWGTGQRATPSRLVADLMDSAIHRRIILSRRYRELGVGLSPGSPMDDLEGTDAVTLAVNFGRRIGHVSRRSARRR